ncbi:WAS/WASL-interacting protein family member 1-like [Arachis ipaensis]|uniref:WAS/WASL-interacting protein family member 1-like n=1 Tax=Arachis ipaensis TaxID=130454 RepID=UPI0007AF00C8|nr:WAS/WASL-interacting protein family member 1-like [Arachis ipaensis]
MEKPDAFAATDRKDSISSDPPQPPVLPPSPSPDDSRPDDDPAPTVIPPPPARYYAFISNKGERKRREERIKIKQGEGEGKEERGKGSRRPAAAAAPLPFALTPEQTRPSPLLLSFPVSDDLLEPELTAGEPLLLHNGAATWSLPCFTTTQQRGASFSSPPPPPVSLPASPLLVPVAEGIRATIARYSPSSPFPSCPDRRRSTTASPIPSFLFSIFIIQVIILLSISVFG